MTAEPDTLPGAPAPWADEGARDRLEGWLREGIATREARQAVRRELGLAPAADDRAVAEALVTRLAEAHVTRVAVSSERRHDPRRSVVPGPAGATDRSFLGQLKGGAASEGRDVRALSDLRTLVAILRGGELRQRRAAAIRIGELVAEGGGKGDARDAAAALEQVRDVEIAHERSLARARLSGAIGRQARAEREAWDAIVARLEPEVRAFWDGDRADEPLAALPGDERAQLLMRVRDLPDVVVDHLAAVVEGACGADDAVRRRALVSSLRYAGDPRLVPSLRAVLEGPDAALAIEAARALARIDDPRAHPALLGAYRRSVVEPERVALAGALGAFGDRRGLEEVRRLLASDDVGERLDALRAMQTLGGAEDCERVAALLDHGDPEVVRRAVRALARMGDGRALAPLVALRERTHVSALWAEIEDAEEAIRARMELRGEPADPKPAPSAALAQSGGARLVERHPVRVRVAGFWHHAVGRMWLLLGAVERAVARFEAAADRRPGWAAPLVAVALGRAHQGRYGEALAAFRRAIEVDRARVEASATCARALALTFLRRAEEMDRDGRADIARGLVDEALALDLRRAPSALRFELKRRHEGLDRAEGA